MHKQQQAETPDIERLQQRHAEQLQQCEQADQRCAETRAQLLDDDKRRRQSQALLAQIGEARAEMQRWGRIAALIGSSDGGAFRKIARATTRIFWCSTPTCSCVSWPAVIGSSAAEVRWACW